MSHPPRPAGPRQLLWFLLLYGGSLVAFSAFVYGFRWFIPR